jgi:ribosomal subunit interface protein
MQIQVRTDNHIDGSAELTRHVQEVVESALQSFADRVTRVEVHLTDESSSQKNIGNDKRCTMEVRLAGVQPIAINAEASSVVQAIDAAAEKLENTVRRTLDRRDDPKGRTSFAGDDPA